MRPTSADDPQWEHAVSCDRARNRLTLAFGLVFGGVAVVWGSIALTADREPWAGVVLGALIHAGVLAFLFRYLSQRYYVVHGQTLTHYHDERARFSFDLSTANVECRRSVILIDGRKLPYLSGPSPEFDELTRRLLEARGG